MNINQIALVSFYLYLPFLVISSGILWYFILKFKRLCRVLETDKFIEQVINQW